MWHRLRYRRKPFAADTAAGATVCEVEGLGHAVAGSGGGRTAGCRTAGAGLVVGAVVDGSAFATGGIPRGTGIVKVARGMGDGRRIGGASSAAIGTANRDVAEQSAAAKATMATLGEG